MEPTVIDPLLVGSAFDVYREEIVEPGKQPLLLLLVAFGATFGLTRFITHSIRMERFGWLGNFELGDTHVHHLVWGILLLLLSGFLAIALANGLPIEVPAVMFGIGAALTLDEFALWLHLEDVYWSEKGRQSIDAVIVFALFAGLALVFGFPIVISTAGHGIEGLTGVLLIQAPFWTFATICFLKGKLLWGVSGLFIPVVGPIGAARLAKPGSWWARRRYGERKLARAHRRYDIEERVEKPA